MNMVMDLLGLAVIILSMVNMGLEMKLAKKEKRKINLKSIVFDLVCIAIVMI